MPTPAPRRRKASMGRTSRCPRGCCGRLGAPRRARLLASGRPLASAADGWRRSARCAALRRGSHGLRRYLGISGILEQGRRLRVNLVALVATLRWVFYFRELRPQCFHAEALAHDLALMVVHVLQAYAAESQGICAAAREEQ